MVWRSVHLLRLADLALAWTLITLILLALFVCFVVSRPWRG